MIKKFNIKLSKDLDFSDKNVQEMLKLDIIKIIEREYPPSEFFDTGYKLNDKEFTVEIVDLEKRIHTYTHSITKEYITQDILNEILKTINANKSLKDSFKDKKSKALDIFLNMKREDQEEIFYYLSEDMHRRGNRGLSLPARNRQYLDKINEVFYRNGLEYEEYT